MKSKLSERIPAVVLSCKGAPYGDLGVVRSLGENGVHVIILSDYPNPPSANSRYCSEFVFVEGYTQAPHLLARALEAIAERHGNTPVVFPTADPDLAALNQLQNDSALSTRSILAQQHLIVELADKRLFGDLAERNQLPVPKTLHIANMQDMDQVALNATFPLIIKPSQATSWKHPAVPKEVVQAKAILVNTLHELSGVVDSLKPIGLQMLIQEYIPGNDAEHYDVHAYVDRAGNATAIFSGRKWRIYPPHAGSGCYVESVDAPALEDLAISILKKINYCGIANINFKRHAITGEFKLIEINPRVSQWNILAARTGVNIPWVAYLDACSAKHKEVVKRKFGIFYLNGKVDFNAFVKYRELGEITLMQYVFSLLRIKMVYQTFQFGDPVPALRLCIDWISEKIKFLISR